MKRFTVSETSQKINDLWLSRMEPCWCFGRCDPGRHTRCREREGYSAPRAHWRL